MTDLHVLAIVLTVLFISLFVCMVGLRFGGMTFLIRRWFHIRTAKKYDIEPDDYSNWFRIVNDWPLRRAIPSYIKWKIRKGLCK